MAHRRLLLMKTLIALFALTLGALDLARSIELPQGYVLAEDSTSPDGRYAVSVPLIQAVLDDVVKDPVNNLVEVATGKTIAKLVGAPAATKMPHGGIMPSRWSPDGSLLLWHVDGKWFPDALTLVKLEDGKVAWQVDLLAQSQKAILAQTKKAYPALYAKAWKENEGTMGSAYPEGFSVDVVAVEPVALPMKVLVDLTSDPKAPHGAATLDSHMEAIVEKDGAFRVTDFALGPGTSPNFR